MDCRGRPTTTRGPLDKRRRLRTRLLGGILALGWAAVGGAQESDPGEFAVREAQTELKSGVYFLDAGIDMRLSTEAAEALESGLPLMLRHEVQFLHRHRLWWDSEHVSINQRYQLEYHALTERYIVINDNTGDQRSFMTLAAALDYTGHLDDLPITDAAVLDADGRYDVRIRSVLDTDELPGPLRLLAFWRRDWSLGSDWYRWPLDAE